MYLFFKKLMFIQLEYNTLIKSDSTLRRCTLLQNISVLNKCITFNFLSIKAEQKQQNKWILHDFIWYWRLE